MVFVDGVVRTDRGAQLVEMEIALEVVVEFHAYERTPFEVFLVDFYFETAAQDVGVGGGLAVEFFDGVVFLEFVGGLARVSVSNLVETILGLIDRD